MIEPYRGPAILAGGYRVFFFLAALWAFVSLVLWVGYMAGVGGLNAVGVDMLQWHGHALIYGYGGAVIAGFALTAIPNWTGRPPVRGMLLLALVLPWLAARVAELMSLTGYEAETARFIGEMLFFFLFVGVAAREVIAGKNWRNIKVVVFFSAFMIAALLANLDRLEIIALPFAGWILGLAIILTLISVIGGRIIPAFTGNWMQKEGLSPKPTMFNRFDVFVILVTIVALVFLIGNWSGMMAGITAAVAGCLHLIRLARWRGWQTLKSPIVVVLHVSYLWVPVGFALVSLAAFGVGGMEIMSAIHAWTVGAIGSTTLAVMTRASLGHAGLPLQDSALLTSIYLAINLAALCRVIAIYGGADFGTFINVAGLLWCVAFGVFIIKFSPIYLRK